MRTRIKICGITRAVDLAAAADAGADAIGLVFYPHSPRCLTLETARRLRQAAAPFVSVVALFVHPSADQVRQVLDAVRPDLLQFHGEESSEFCEQFKHPYLKACRVRPGIDLLNYWRPFMGACGWLADAYVDAYGGVGARFDWSQVPLSLPRPLILSGGLDAANVAAAIHQVRPWGVDVSSGVETSKGIKDAGKIASFVHEVRNATV